MIVFVAAALMSVTYNTAVSQSQESPAHMKHRTAAWVSDNGYWVVGSNIHARKNNVISVYNNRNILVYQEELNGVTIKTAKRQVRMKLKRLVDIAVADYALSEHKQRQLLAVRLFKK